MNENNPNYTLLVWFIMYVGLWSGKYA